jgi:sugar phosphate isomerase/epimerase
MKPAIISMLCILFLTTSCKEDKKNQQDTPEPQVKAQENKPFFKLSLAQWSLHRTFNNDGVSPFKFAEISKDMGFEGVEYVNHLYSKQIDSLGFDTVIDSLNSLSQKHGMQNVLIMVDNEGDLASPDEAERNKAVENHKKWVDAAKKLGCHSIRVNTFGTNDPKQWLPAVVDGLKKLSTYAATQNINVLCENHGWLSSDAYLLMEAVGMVNMDNCGTLPDFGNWCVKRKDGEKWSECVEEFSDKYKGIQMMLKEAEAVSAKSYDFDQNGNETTLDYSKIMQMVKDSGYKGFVGVEYEGENLPEKEGIIATKELLLSSAKTLK